MPRNPFATTAWLLSLATTATAVATSIPLTNHSGEINNGIDRAPVSDPAIPGWGGDGQVIAGRTDYGNGAWRLSFEDSGSLHNTTTHEIQSGAAYSLRFDAAAFTADNAGAGFDADLTLVAPGLLNGDFNENSSPVDAHPFSDTPNWFNIATTGANQQATRASPPNVLLDGSRNAVLAANGSRHFAIDSVHTLAEGEIFQVSYQWRDASGWNDTADRVAASLFTTDDDSPTGNRTILQTIASDTSTANNTFETATAVFAPIPASAAGKRLFASFTGVDGNGDNAGFARVDNFLLQRGTPSGPTSPRPIIADIVAADGDTREVVLSHAFDFKSSSPGVWNHYHLAVPAGTLEPHVGKRLGVGFRSEESPASRFQSVDNVRLDFWPADPPDGSFADTWDTPARQVWLGPGYWANRLHDWRIDRGRAECTLGGRDRRTAHRVGTSIRGNGGDLSLSVRTGPNTGTPNPNARTGFLLGAGPNLDWRGALLVHDGLGRDFGLFVGLRGNGSATIEDLTAGAVTNLAAGTTPPGGLQPDTRLALDATYDPDTATYRLTVTARNPGGTLLSTAAATVPSDQLLGSLGLLSHRGSGNTTFWFDDFTGTGTALNPEPDRHLAVLGTLYTLSRGTLKLTAQLSPVDLQTTPSATLEVHDGATWQELQTVAIDRTDNLSSYTAPFRVEGWDATGDTPFRVRVDIAGTPYYWSGTVRRDPVDNPDLVVASTNCQRIADGAVQNDGFDWSPARLWQPHTLTYHHLTKHQPDLFLALGDQIYEGQPTPEDSGTTFNRQHDYLYKWYLWVLQSRDITRQVPTVSIPDDHDVYQGNLWGEGGIATNSQNSGGYEEPASWVRLVERTQTSHLPDPDPYNPVQPAPPVAQGIGVYFTGMVYGGVGFAVLEDRKFKTGRDNPPADPAQQFLLGDRQKDFLRAWNTDWTGQQMKCVLSQSPFGNLHTHANRGYGYGLNDRDTHGWPTHRRIEAWQLLRQSHMFQIAGDQHLATVVKHGTTSPRDAGYSFTAPAIANFFPRCWDPVHNAAGRTNTISPYKGDFFLDGNGTLPTGQPNLTSIIPNHIQVVAVANPLEYHNLTTGHSPANLHDRGAGYGIVRIHKDTRTVTLEAWPIHVDPTLPQTGTQFPDWPVTFAGHHNDGRTPTGFLDTVDTGWRSDLVARLYDESDDALVYSIRTRGNRFRPPVYNNGTTYRLELADPDSAFTTTSTGLAPGQPAPPTIHAFRALTPAITAGATATLQWDTGSPATLTIDNGIGDVSLLTAHGIGQVDVSPATDTTYTLTLDGNQTATTTVRVYPDKTTWLNTHFSPAERADPLVSGDDADPDNDDLTNADEFRYQSDPRSRSTIAPTSSIVTDNDQQFVEFDLPVPVDQITPAPVSESATDLKTWSLLPPGTATEISRDNFPPDGTPRLRIRIGQPLPESSPQTFYRIYWPTP